VNTQAGEHPLNQNHRTEVDSAGEGSAPGHSPVGMPNLQLTLLRMTRLSALAAAASLTLTGAGAGEAGRRALPDSVRAVAPQSAPGSRIVRTALTQEEMVRPMTISISLRMRNFAQFEARLALGQNLVNGGFSRAELEANFLPSAADYSAVRAWLSAQGFTIAQDDVNHTTVFAQGSVERVAEAFQVSFARVATADGEFTSAVTTPSLPDALPPSVLTVDGLQPHIRANHAPLAAPQAGGHSTGPYVAPSDVRAAYAVPSTLTGGGQTIAIIMAATVSDSDLEQFWTAADVPQSTGNLTTIPINGGPGSSEQSSFALESAIDVEWASSTAPGASIRLYATSDLLFSTINQACLQVLQDAQTNPGLNVVSMSVAGPEDQLSAGSYQGYSQTFAQLAVAGITALACSGDGGSNPNPNLTNEFGASYPLSVEYPASDPYVIGVGGTNLTLTSSWNYAGEATWSSISSDGAGTGGTLMASGGGVSELPRKSWQTDGEQVLSTNVDQRCVPDVSAIAIATTMSTDPASTTYAAIVLNGSLSGCYGTSLGTPIWAGIVAMINQEREAYGLAPVGLLGPAIYPLHGTLAFNDITSGSNGTYSAGHGYDLCTGLGTPNVAYLADALSGVAPGSGAPPSGSVTEPAPSSPLGAGSALALSAGSSGPGLVSYQWYLNGVAIGGATAASYDITAGAEDAGAYSVALTNTGGTTTLDAGTLTVATNAWLANLAARAHVDGTPNLLIAGFVTSGPSPKAVLVRGDGPSLAAFGISDSLANPQLSLVNSSGAALASNTAWPAGLAPLFKSLGAFSFAQGSDDTAILQSVPAGAYTALVSSGTSQGGVAEAEVYDADDSAPANRLTNLAARAFVGSGTNILIGGFVIAGATSETVVVRGVGPGLAAFGLTGLLSNPVLSVFDESGTMIAQNTGWGNPVTATGAAAESATVSDFTRVNAFALDAGSADSAMVITLPPGSYTAQLSGAEGSVAPAGIGLVEIYEMR
jgi:kumamolisin